MENRIYKKENIKRKYLNVIARIRERLYRSGRYKIERWRNKN